VTNELETLRKFGSNRDAHTNWQTADELYFGWFAYSPFELKERYRDSGQNEALSKSLELEMQMLIRERIGSGEIVALGVQILPELKSEAEQIPKILFQSAEVDIDWECGRISGLGRQFNDARICLSAETNTPPVKGIAPVAANANRGGGRPSQYMKIREVLQELFADHPAYQQFPAARLLETFNIRYLAKFAAPGVSIAPVSERSLRQHLKTYRQELAGTGKN
jgi:hypothetical protein